MRFEYAIDTYPSHEYVYRTCFPALLAGTEINCQHNLLTASSETNEVCHPTAFQVTIRCPWLKGVILIHNELEYITHLGSEENKIAMP